MQVREASRVEDTTHGSDSYSAGWRYYLELQFSLGDGRTVLAEVEYCGQGADLRQKATIRGVFEGLTHAPAGEFYNVTEASAIIADLRARGIETILVVEDGWARTFDPARLKDGQ